MNNRIALCIGISDYDELELRLPNAANDAQRIHEVLKARGFKSTLLLNPTGAALTRAAADFRTKVAACAKDRMFGVVFYAGHATEIGGFGILMPADIPLPVFPTTLKHCGVPVLELVDSLREGKGAKVVIIDACRDAVANWSGAQMQQFHEWANEETERLKDAAESDDVTIAYSTTSGQPAYDGCGANSAYSEKLKSALLRHDVSIVEALTECGQQVIADTLARQTPWVYTNHSTKAGFTDLPTYSLVSSTTLTKKWSAGTRLHTSVPQGDIAVNLGGRLLFLRDGKEWKFIDHDESFTAVAFGEGEILFAGPRKFVSLECKESKLQPTSELKTNCREAHGIVVAPDGAFAIVYGLGGYSIMERVEKGWRSHSKSKQLSDVYSAVFESDRVVYLCGSGDYILRLELGRGVPRAKKIELGDYFHVYDLSLVSEGQLIAAVCNEGTVVWIDIAGGKVERQLKFEWPSVDVPGAYGRLRRMELSPEEANLFLNDPEQFEVKYGPSLWSRTYREGRPDYHLLCCDVTADSRVLAVGADSGLIFLIDIRSREHFATLDAGSDIGVPFQWMACAANGAIHVLAQDDIVRCFEPVYPPL